MIILIFAIVAALILFSILRSFAAPIAIFVLIVLVRMWWMGVN